MGFRVNTYWYLIFKQTQDVSNGFKKTYSSKCLQSHRQGINNQKNTELYNNAKNE